MANVLLSCIGTTDPIRYHRDGPVLHILREFRPDIVVLFITYEMRANADKDHWIAKVRDHMKRSWGYEPQWIEEHVPIKDPSNLDLVYNMMDPVLKRYLRKHADDRILVNLSSGTPQLKYLMIDLATDLRYNTTGIQVSNPTGTAGKGGRTNEDSYRVNQELLDNLDESPETYLCHWSIPEMISVKRNQAWEQLRSVLDQRDFEAAEALKIHVGVPADRMLEHLVQRSRLNGKKAREAIVSLWQSDLYPIRFFPKDGHVQEICEYYLILRNMQRTGRITEFILRLNPFIVRLQMCLVDGLLQSRHGFALGTLLDPTRPERYYFLAERLRQRSGELYRKVGGYFRGPGVRDADMSILLGNAFLTALGAAPGDIRFFEDCELLNSELRNSAAHDLKNYTDGDIRRCLGYDSNELIRNIEDTIPVVFPQYSHEQFRKYYQVYDYGVEFIKARK